MIFHLFTLLFVGLKLAAIINWSWWLVLLPSILVVGIPLAIMLFALVMAALVARRR